MNGDSVSGATSNSLLVSEEGWYNMIKTNQDGCSDSASVGVFVEEFDEPDPDLGADDALATMVLDAGFIAGASYIWLPFAQGQTYSVSDTGTYISIVTSAEGCIGIDTIYIGYNPEATVELGTDTVICDTASILLDAGAGLAGYTWSTGESTQTVVVDMNAVPTGDTSVTVLVTVVNSIGCSAIDSVTVSFKECPDTTIGISGVNSGLISVYPNPRKGSVTLESQTSLMSVTVVDALGSLIFSDKLNSNRAQLNISSPGLYFITLKDNLGRTYIERIVVQ